MSNDPRDTIAVDKLQVAVTPNLLDAVKAAARFKGLTTADYVRGAVQVRMMLDGASFPPMQLGRTTRGLRPAAIDGQVA